MLCQYCSAKLTSLPLLHGHSQNINGAAPAAVMGLEQAYMLQGPHALWPRTCQVAALCCCAHLQPCRSLASCFQKAFKACLALCQSLIHGKGAAFAQHARTNTFKNMQACTHRQAHTCKCQRQCKGVVTTGAKLHLKVCQIKAILHGLGARLWYDSSHTAQLLCCVQVQRQPFLKDALHMGL